MAAFSAVVVLSGVFGGFASAFGQRLAGRRTRPAGEPDDAAQRDADDQAALRASERRYRLAAARWQVWEWTVATGRLCVSREFWGELGVAPPAADDAYETFRKLLHPDDRDRWRHALGEHLARRVPYDLVFRARHADDRWLWFQTHGQAVWDSAGRATYMAGMTYDITDRKETEQQLFEAEAYRRNVFEQLGDGVFLIDREQRFTDANPQALAMVGYTHDELLSLRVADVLPEFERGRVAQGMAAVMDGKPQFALWWVMRRDGSDFPVEVSAHVLDARRFVAVVRDISTRRRSEAAALTAQLELSELTQRLLSQESMTTRRIAQALHDHLGQTLVAARLNLDALLMQKPDLPHAHREQGVRVALLLDQAVGEVRRVLADLRPPLLEAEGLAQALSAEVDSLVVTSRSVDVLLEIDDGSARLRWPPDVEYSAFMIAREAIANAQQHADASLVRVLIQGTATSLGLQVIDDGVGIPGPMMLGRPGHLGIVGMRERAMAVGGRFSVGRDGLRGTSVSFRWEAGSP